MDKTLSVDVAVIGAGTAGLAAYRAAKAAGATAVVVEGGPYGTTCARVGCMPSKLLIAAAEAAHGISRARGFGVHAGEPRIDGPEVMARVKRERDRFVGFVLNGVESIPEADKIRGYAKFVDRNTLDVGGARITARSIVIATGSRPADPADPRGLGRSPRRARRCLLVGHAAALGGGVRPRRDRPGARPGPGPPRRARGGAGPRWPRGTHLRSGSSQRRHRSLHVGISSRSRRPRLARGTCRQWKWRSITTR